jgi:ABC-type polysaccharide/polyol phosphate export permease
MENTGFQRSRIVYDSAHRGPLALEELRGVIRYRELIGQLIKRDIISRYKRSVLGVAWTMLNPLGTMLILTLVFSNLFHSVAGYPIYILSGLIGWNFFAQTSSAALNQNVWGGTLLHRIYVPRTAFTLSSLGTGIVNFLLTLIPLTLIMLIIQYPLHASFLFVPISLLILAIFSLGLGLLFSTIAIYFPDIVEMYGVALTAWMYITPIIYPEAIITGPLKLFLFTLNPMYYFIRLIRLPIYDGIVPSFSTIGIALAISLVTFLVGWCVFTRKANDLTYRT